MPTAAVPATTVATAAVPATTASAATTVATPAVAPAAVSATASGAVRRRRRVVHRRAPLMVRHPHLSRVPRGSGVRVARGMVRDLVRRGVRLVHRVDCGMLLVPSRRDVLLLGRGVGRVQLRVRRSLLLMGSRGQVLVLRGAVGFGRGAMGLRCRQRGVFVPGRAVIAVSLGRRERCVLVRCRAVVAVGLRCRQRRLFVGRGGLLVRQRDRVAVLLARVQRPLAGAPGLLRRQPGLSVLVVRGQRRVRRQRRAAARGRRHGGGAPRVLRLRALHHGLPVQPVLRIVLPALRLAHPRSQLPVAVRRHVEPLLDHGRRAAGIRPLTRVIVLRASVPSRATARPRTRSCGIPTPS